MPQGSILGFLFFAIYVNDLDEVVPDDSLFMFVDDMSVMGPHVVLSSISIQLLSFPKQIMLLILTVIVWK